MMCDIMFFGSIIIFDHIRFHLTYVRSVNVGNLQGFQNLPFNCNDSEQIYT